MVSRSFRLLCLIPFLLLLIALCAVSPSVHSAPVSIPQNVPISRSSETARQATLHFWEVFHGNDYAHVDEVIAHLTAAWQENPNDATVTLLLGASHLWKFHERGRCQLPAAAVQHHAVMSLWYCQKAQELDPHKRITPGFIEVAKANVGILQGDAALVEESFQGLRRNTCQDPVMHGANQGWAFSALLAADDCRYPEVFEGFYATIDNCAGFPPPRCLPITGPLINTWLAFRARKKDVVCYNNDVVPHLLEGSMLALGDAYLKQGKIAQACMAYKSAKRSPSYPCWKYQEQLEVRLENLEALKIKFRAETGKFDVSEPAMSYLSSFSCTGCHAR